MATSTYPSKRHYGCAVKEKTTTGLWDNTPEAVGALDELFVNSDGDPQLKQEFKPFGGLNQIMSADGDLGPSEAVDWSIPIDGEGCGLQYEMGSFGSLIAGLFSTMTTPAQQGGTAAYKHVFDWANDSTQYFTFASERPGDIWEVPSCVPMKLTLKPSNGFLQGSMSMRGNSLNNTSTVNTATQLDAITKAASGNIIRFQDGIFRMNTQAGDALDSGDNVTLVDFEVSLERTKNARTALGGAYIAEPLESASLGTLKIKIPGETGGAAAWFAAFLAKTAQKVTIIFTSPTLAATGYYYSFAISFPRLMPKIAPGVKLEDIIDSDLEFLILEAAAAPTGMTGHVRPFVEAINLRATAYVA